MIKLRAGHHVRMVIGYWRFPLTTPGWHWDGYEIYGNVLILKVHA